MEQKEFGYVASPQSTEEKHKPSNSKLNKATGKDPHDFKVLERALKRVKLPSDAWIEIKKDLKAGAGKDTICRKYGIKRSYYKHLKKLLIAM